MHGKADATQRRTRCGAVWGPLLKKREKERAAFNEHQHTAQHFGSMTSVQRDHPFLRFLSRLLAHFCPTLRKLDRGVMDNKTPRIVDTTTDHIDIQVAKYQQMTLMVDIQS